MVHGFTPKYNQHHDDVDLERRNLIRSGRRKRTFSAYYILWVSLWWNGSGVWKIYSRPWKSERQRGHSDPNWEEASCQKCFGIIQEGAPLPENVFMKAFWEEGYYPGCLLLGPGGILCFNCWIDFQKKGKYKHCSLKHLYPACIPPALQIRVLCSFLLCPLVSLLWGESDMSQAACGLQGVAFSFPMLLNLHGSVRIFLQEMTPGHTYHHHTHTLLVTRILETFLHISLHWRTLETGF